MRSGYILNKTLIEKLSISGLVDRVAEFKRSDDCPHFGSALYSFDLPDIIFDLKKNNYLEHIQANPDYRKIANQLLSNLDGQKWTINNYSESVDVKDALIFFGEYASYLIKPDELNNYADFGFENVLDFSMSLSAYMYRELGYSPIKHGKGLPWTTTTKDGKNLSTIITGTDHGDFCVERYDLSPKQTITPFGNTVEFRPYVSDMDHETIISPMTPEPSFFIILMKYLESVDDQSTEKLSELRSWASSLTQRGGPWTESFMLDEIEPESLLVDYNRSIPKLNANNESEERSIFSFERRTTSVKGYLTQDNDLALTNFHEKNYMNVKKDIIMTFEPHEAYDLVKSTLYQVSCGAGRSSLKAILPTLDYRLKQLGV